MELFGFIGGEVVWAEVLQCVLYLGLPILCFLVQLLAIHVQRESSEGVQLQSVPTKSDVTVSGYSSSDDLATIAPDEFAPLANWDLFTESDFEDYIGGDGDKAVGGNVGVDADDDGIAGHDEL